VSSPALRVVEQIQTVLVDTDVVTALDDSDRERDLRETLAELAEADFEVVMKGPDYAAVRQEAHGADGFRQLWADWTAPFEWFTISVDETI
jgi:hypothetical protein